MYTDYLESMLNQIFTLSYFHKLDASFINVQNKKFKEKEFTFFISLWNIQSLNADNLIKDHTSTSPPEIPCQLSSNMDIEEDSLSRYKDLEKTTTIQYVIMHSTKFTS